MEETNLRGVHTSRSGGDNDFNVGNTSGFSNGLSFVTLDSLFQIKDGFVGENQTEFSDQKGFKDIQFFIMTTESLVKF